MESEHPVKLFGWASLAIGIFGLLIFISWAFIYGMVWISALLYPIATALAAIGTVVLVLMLLPSSIFKGSRRFCGKGIVGVSYLWGISVWMYSVLVLYTLWGFAGMFLGFAFLQVGAPALASIALLFAGEFRSFGSILLMLALVYGVRALGHWIVSKGETPFAAEVRGLANRLGYDMEQIEEALQSDPEGTLLALREENLEQKRTGL